MYSFFKDKLVEEIYIKFYYFISVEMKDYDMIE